MKRILLVTLLLFPMTLFSYEEAKYQLLFQDDDFEVRRYLPALIAEASNDGNWKDANSKSFGVLGGYIFGDNKQEQKIAMTTPVETSSIEGYHYENHSSKRTMRFFMPRQYKQEQLPAPTSTQMKFIDLPERIIAVYKFSGFYSDSNFKENSEKLQTIVDKYKLNRSEDESIAVYNSPWTPWFLRRNEIWQPIESWP
jgi:hypothetical protein